MSAIAGGVEMEKIDSYASSAGQHGDTSPLLGRRLEEEPLEHPKKRRKLWTRVCVLLGLICAPAIAVSFWKSPSVLPLSFATWLEDSTRNLADVFPPPDAVCSYCDCSTNPPSLLKDHYRGPLRSRDHLSAFVRRQILAGYCRRIFMTPSASYALINTRRRPEELVAWNLTSLRLGLPTTYLFTKTHPTSKTGARRGDYIRRHTNTIRRFQANRTMYGYEDGTRAEDRQLIYIVVEDSPFIQTDIAGVLADSGVPFIYFAHGPTRHYGNAQHNAAVALIRSLSNPEMKALGHGPVLSADDDSEIHEDLLHYVWRVKRFGAWQMGNLGPSSWEGPMWDDRNQTIIAWPAYLAFRKFPLDAGAFVFNSSLLGSEALPGPIYWKDVNGGETEFLEAVVGSRENIEPICNRCRLTWHNQPLDISTLWLKGLDPLPPFPTIGYDELGHLLPGWEVIGDDPDKTPTKIPDDNLMIHRNASVHIRHRTFH